MDRGRFPSRSLPRRQSPVRHRRQPRMSASRAHLVGWRAPSTSGPAAAGCGTCRRSICPASPRPLVRLGPAKSLNQRDQIGMPPNSDCATIASPARSRPLIGSGFPRRQCRPLAFKKPTTCVGIAAGRTLAAETAPWRRVFGIVGNWRSGGRGFCFDAAPCPAPARREAHLATGGGQQQGEENQARVHSGHSINASVAWSQPFAESGAPHSRLP